MELLLSPLTPEKYLSPCFFSAYVNYAEASRSWLIIQMCLLYISSMLVLSLFAHKYLFFMNLFPISGDKNRISTFVPFIVTKYELKICILI